MKDEDQPEAKAPAKVDALVAPDGPAAPWAAPEASVDAVPADLDPELDPASQPLPDAEAEAVVKAEAAIEAAAVAKAKDASAQPVLPPVSPAAPPKTRRRSGFVAALLGGALAAIGGFALSHYNLLSLQPAQDPAALDARFMALESKVNQELEALRPAVAAADSAAKQASSDAAAAKAGLAPTAAELKALSERLAALDATLAKASAATEGGASAAAVAALAAELETLKARPSGSDENTRAIVQQALQAWESEASARADAGAQAAKAQALAQAAQLALAQAVETGAPYQSALTALGAQDVPPALAKFAESGLPTLAALQDRYPDAARAALEAALQSNGAEGDSVWNFLRLQTGARSLTPQAGSDPDAVLSRAEAALRTGNLDQALQELAALPPAGQTAMADWTTAAQARADATKALAPLMSAAGSE